MDVSIKCRVGVDLIEVLDLKLGFHALTSSIISDAKFLVQGTIAPDWIETKGEIKSHHNLALPSGMELELCEPIRDLYKDENIIVYSTYSTDAGVCFLVFVDGITIYFAGDNIDWGGCYNYYEEICK